MRGMDGTEDHVIICGLGRSGYRILEVLIRLDQRVVVIEHDGDSQFVEPARRDKVPVIVADVRNPGVLEDAGIETARAIIACTDDDLTNLEIALDARSIRPDIRVVLRMFDDRLAEKIADGFNIQVALSTSALAAPAFAAAAVDRSVQGSLDVGGRVYIHSEFEVPAESSMAGLSVADLRNDYEVYTLAVQDGDRQRRWSPPLDHEIEGGSEIAVVGPFAKVARLKEELGVTQDLVRARETSESRFGF